MRCRPFVRTVSVTVSPGNLSSIELFDSTDPSGPEKLCNNTNSCSVQMPNTDTVEVTLAAPSVFGFTCPGDTSAETAQSNEFGAFVGKCTGTVSLKGYSVTATTS